MAEINVDPGFAPASPTDGRKPGDWTSRYQDAKAVKWIRIEATYLAFHLAAVMIAVFLLELKYPPNDVICTETANPLGWQQLLHSWLGGLLGGTLFGIKWLYHTVAKTLWHVDRRLWRLFMPHLSAALALAFTILLASGLLVIVDRSELSSKWVCFAVSFLAGYFSDNATAKMAEVAATVFGTTQKKDDEQKQRP